MIDQLKVGRTANFLTSQIRDPTWLPRKHAKLASFFFLFITLPMCKYAKSFFSRKTHSQTRTYTHLHKYTHATYPYENLRKTEPHVLEIDKIIVHTSLLATIERTASIKS
jgi:hypothetical protein